MIDSDLLIYLNMKICMAGLCLREGTRMTHLYLILDDWESGYSFRMIDCSSNDSAWLIPGGIVPGGIAREAGTSLPRPFFCLNAERRMHMHFASIGSKILAMPPSAEDDNIDIGGVCLDVHTRGVIFVPRHANQHRPMYFHIGRRLFGLDCSFFQFLDMQVLDSPGIKVPWCDLPKPPFDPSFAISHALLPNEETIFVSVGFIGPDATFSFHIAEDGSMDWKRISNWMMPFRGRAYFDHKLDTWIGLPMLGVKRGYICSCQLKSGTTEHRPEVKYSNEYLFSGDPAETHIGATLVCMGQKGKYCLIESVGVKYLKQEEEYNFKQENEYFRCMFRLTTFSLAYNENGDLTTGESQRVRYFFAPKDQISRPLCQFPVGFYM